MSSYRRGGIDRKGKRSREEEVEEEEFEERERVERLWRDDFDEAKEEEEENLCSNTQRRARRETGKSSKRRERKRVEREAHSFGHQANMGQETVPVGKTGEGSGGDDENLTNPLNAANVSSSSLSLENVQVRHMHPDATRVLDVMGLSGCRYKCRELVRVVEQALYTLGYPDVAKHLEKASGVDLHSQRVQKLQEGCLSGKWEEVIKLIDQEKRDLFGSSARDYLEGNGATASSTLGPQTSGNIEESVKRAKFLVLEQKYLESLSSGNVMDALLCLREEITPLEINMERLHELASLMRCRSWQDLVECKAWGTTSSSTTPSTSAAAQAPSLGANEGAGASVTPLSAPADTAVNNSNLGLIVGGASASKQASRQQLLTKLQEVIPSSVMLPENRLESLLGQAVAHQVSHCMYYNKTDTTFSLLSDYACGPEQIPSRTAQVLDGHNEEVWHVQFSNDGKMLASASADGTCIIWELAEVAESNNNLDFGNGSSNGSHYYSETGEPRKTKKFRVMHELLGHKKPIAFVCWSPNDKYLLTCGNDNMLNVWDVEKGKLHQKYEKHVDSVTSCAWLPDSEKFVSGSIDKHIYMWHLDGRCIRHWKGSRINDLAISRNGKWMVSTSNEKKFLLYDLVKDTELTVQEQESIISLCLSKQSDLLLVNLQNQKIHLWDLNDFFASQGTCSLPTEPVRRYRGQQEKQGRYVIRSCFGGSNEAFVVSGSEDSQVYIWHQQKGELLKVLSGHSGTVNAVTWNPVDPYTFASASDDHSIRIWVTPNTNK